ncbi:MLP-like protein 43 [Senna tora]|uniref:MLP-like protein 43 n=1 Tax=Senna tora TaxID=362788 RepID=A0A834W989_9FABA|nr:MLP-like protein 43 [Senna tora]
MALKGKIGAETEIQSSASKFFNFFVTQLDELQNITDEVHETKLHQGDWHGVGSHSVKHWNFSSEATVQKFEAKHTPGFVKIHLSRLNFKSMFGGKVVDCKEHIEEIDNANKTILYKLFDGEFGEHKYKSGVKLKLKVVEKDEGAIVKWTHKFEKVHEAITPPLEQLDSLIKATKEVDAYLLKA